MLLIDKEKVQRYFAKASKWIKQGYRQTNYNYPLAHHRLRIILKILSASKRPLKIADLGCGGANVSIALAEQGYEVWGVEQSQSMITEALRQKSTLPKRVQSHLHLICQPLEECSLKEHFFDIVISMGVIGYLPNDASLFSMAKRLLKPSGLLLVSARNRLFNMTSISDRTVREIERGNAKSLISELNDLYTPIAKNDVRNFVEQVKKMAKDLNKNIPTTNHSSKRSIHLKLASGQGLEARQHTPEGLKRVASQFGFTLEKYFGVHPHLMSARFNYFLPPQVFDAMSSCLEALEHLPVSLIWSSCFLGVFKKG